MDEQDEDPYNVPPSSPHQANYVARHLPHKLDEEAPPKLKPKKGTNSFRISFAALDSKALPSTPKPAPRRLSHKESSVDSQPDEPVGEEQHISSKGEASFDLITCNTAECLETSQTKSSPQEEMEEKTTSVALPDNTVTSSSDSMDTTLLNVMGDSSKSSVARPKPKPRMRIPKVSSNSDKNNTMGKQESEQISIAAPEIALQVNNVNDDGINADGQQCRYSNIPFNIPPDADSLESVFNKELEDKYGFENTFWNNDTTSTPLSCIEGSNLSKENDPYDSDDDYSRTLAEEDGVEDFGNKKPQVKDSSQSLPPSTEVGVDSAAAFISKDITSEKLQALFPLPLDPSPNSSSFDIGNKDISERKLNFEDLQDLDPLMQNKTDKIDEKRNEKDNPWEFQYSMATTDISSESNSLYSEATTFIDTEKVGETNQSISDIVSKAFEILPELESSGWQEPLAPPPPLPDEAKIISPHVPPPIPPRPDLPNRPDKLILTSSNEDKAALQGNELIDQALREDEVSSSSIFDELPTPQFSSKPDNGDPFQGSEFGDDCIEFNTKTEQSASPSALSLSSQSLPTPPSPSTKPKPLSRSSVQGAVPPSDDPERISRFVPPPPGAKFRRNDANLEYDLALEGESDSDDEDEVPPSFRQSDERDMPQAMDPRRSLLTMEPHSPKKNIREGFLNKQGGFNANKGWRKRWVVFDGSKLSYYSSNKSQVSNRVVPVSCIKNVEIDPKSDGLKFKVFSTLKDRVFVFQAEKRDDCTMWANILMAEVVAHKKKSKAETGAVVPPKPDKEGFIHFSNMKEYYVTITGQTLRYFQSFDDFQEGSPVHEIDMKLASVKDNESKKQRLQLWVHYGHFELSFPSEHEKQQWRLAMEDAIAEGLSDDTVLKKVYENLSNQKCADCGADNPHWASINLGIVVCKNCAGVHRMFDFRISKIKSLRMDTRVWTPSLVELIVTVGNANANLFWASKLTSGEAIHSKDTIEKRKHFIMNKYVHKKYADKHPLLNLKPALGEELLKAAKDDNVLETMRILFSGADVMYRQNGDGPTAYELVKQSGQRLVLEFLFQNGGDPQSLVDNVQDENRLREDVRLQGFLNKTGPLGKSFERRWCVIEHGALSYYVNEKNNMIRGSIDRKDMVMISAIENDRMGYQFELSTTIRDNRTYIFSSDIKDDTGEWMRTIAKLMAPVAVMEHVGMIDIQFAGYAYMKELVNEWRQTFLVFSWRILKFMNKDLKFDYIDLRKASSIRMQDSSNGYQNQGPCFVISSTGWSVYLQASLPRDTEKMYNCLLGAITTSGSTLSDQALTSNDIPVIVDRCITHVEVHGLMETGVYRTAGQSSRVQALLDSFRKDALSVSLSEFPISEVADTLKRFLRELDDSVFERIYYPAWISAAGIADDDDRLRSYEYYLKKMPIVNFSTLKRIILHLLQVSEHHAVNKMPIANLASCFAPSLMRTNKDTDHLTGDVYSKEIKVIIDLLQNKDFFFHADEEERIRAINIKMAQSRIREVEEELRHSVLPANLTAQSWLVPCQILDRDHSVNVKVTETSTAAETMGKLIRSLPQQETYALYEVLFKGSLVRPIFPNDYVAKTAKRWMEFDAFVDEEIGMSLSVRGMQLLEILDNYNLQSHSLQAELQYSDPKSKKFKSKTVRFKQCQLAVYNKAKDADAAACWNVEDLSFYVGAWPKRNSAPGFFLTFLENDKKYTKAFGHCLGFSSEEDLYKWASVLYAVQNPDGLLGWASVNFS